MTTCTLEQKETIKITKQKHTFLVIGCGSIGERHIKNLLSLGQTVYCYDREIGQMESMVTKYGVSVLDFKAKHIQVDAFVICTPPTFHLPFAREALEHGAHIFIEKPISHRLEGVDEVIAEAKRQGKVLQVGYQLRFHPGLKLVKKLLDEGRIGKLLSIRAEFGQYLPDWHPTEDYRNLYTAHRSAGGGILLDASHELDYVMWLVGSKVTEVHCIAGKLSSLDVDVEDTAEILLRFGNNVISNIHIDFVQRGYTRWCKLIGEEGTLFWNYLWEGEIQMTSPQKGFGTTRFTYVPRDTYVKEMQHFIACVEGKAEPIVDGETAKSVLEVVLKTKEQGGYK